LRLLHVLAKSFLVVAPIPVALLYSQTATKPRATSSVHFAVFDHYGSRSYYVERFTDTRTGVDYSRYFKLLDARDVPHAGYEYVLKRTDVKKPIWSPIRGKLEVYLPEHWLELNPSGVYFPSGDTESRPDEAEMAPAPVTGIVTPVPDTLLPLWIRIEPAHSRGRIETGVDKNGDFHLYDLPSGPYVLIVFDKNDNAIHAQPLNADDSRGPQRLVIELKIPSPDR